MLGGMRGVHVAVWVPSRLQSQCIVIAANDTVAFVSIGC